MKSAETVLRVERGNPDDVELAALTAVLIALHAGGRQADEDAPASDFRWWRGPAAYSAPDSWH